MAVPTVAKPTDIHVRVPADLYEQVQALAEQEQRSVNWMLLDLVRVGVKERTRRHSKRNEAA